MVSFHVTLLVSWRLPIGFAVLDKLAQISAGSLCHTSAKLLGKVTPVQ